MAAILETVQNGGSEQWMNKHENNTCISLHDANDLDARENVKKKKTFWGEKVTKIAKYALQCGGHLVCNPLKT